MQNYFKGSTVDVVDGRRRIHPDRSRPMGCAFLSYLGNCSCNLGSRSPDSQSLLSFALTQNTLRNVIIAYSLPNVVTHTVYLKPGFSLKPNFCYNSVVLRIETSTYIPAV